MGQPPDMNLTLVMNNITASDSGLWMLEIENELGTASVEFRVHVRDGKSFAFSIFYVLYFTIFYQFLCHYSSLEYIIFWKYIYILVKKKF